MSGKKWQGWGVSEIGPLHVKEQLPNQDSFLIRKFTWGIVGVVCDGLGSKDYSHIGSAALTKAVVRTASLFDFTTEITLFEPLLTSLWNIYIHPYDRDNTATTLLFTIIKDQKVFTGRVGDGAIVLLGKKNTVIEETKDQFTNFTTPFGRDLKIEWNIYNENEVESILICSDGVSEDIKPSLLISFSKEYIKSYKNFSSRKRVHHVKKWLRFWPVKGHTDDKTIVALYRDNNE